MEGNSEEQQLEKLVLKGQLLLETKDLSNPETSSEIPPNDDGIIDEPRQNIEGINSTKVTTVTPPVVNHNPTTLVTTITSMPCLALPSPGGLQNGRQPVTDSKKRSHKNKAQLRTSLVRNDH